MTTLIYDDSKDAYVDPETDEALPNGPAEHGLVWRVAARYLKRAGYFNVGDYLLMGDPSHFTCVEGRACHASTRTVKGQYTTTGYAENTPKRGPHVFGSLERHLPMQSVPYVEAHTLPKGCAANTTRPSGDTATLKYNSKNPTDLAVLKEDTATSVRMGETLLSTDMSWNSSSEDESDAMKLSTTSTVSSMTTDQRTLSCGLQDTPQVSVLKTTLSGHATFSSYTERCSLSERVAARFLRTSGFFNVGDYVWMGKYKNKLGQITAFGADEKGNPTVTIRPVPQGRKQDKTFSLFKVWKVRPEQLEELRAKAKIAAGTPRGWEHRKEQDERAKNNIPREYWLTWEKLKGKFRGTPDQRAEQFMEYLEEHPGEDDEIAQQYADREVAKLKREQQDQARKERVCEKDQDKYEEAWYKEQERATKERAKLKQLKEKADSACRACPTCHYDDDPKPAKDDFDDVPFAASCHTAAMAKRVANRHKARS